VKFVCTECGHTFHSDAESFGPEGCPECGGLDIEEEVPQPEGAGVQGAHVRRV
jgi:predicted  nucleic acid-binding Zn-ribbon protein